MEINKVYNEDCIGEKGMCLIPDKSIDMILCDLPYGTIKGKLTEWDVIIPFDKLWQHYERIIKENGAIVLFGREPFTSLIVSSNFGLYKHKWVWDKKQSGSYHNAKYMPLQIEEDIIVMCRGTVKYYPKMVSGKMRFKGGAKKNSISGSSLENNVGYMSDEYFPVNILELYNPKVDRLHPTQKPTTLLEYLIETYTTEGETVLDNCMGSGTTAIACINTNRNYIGFEKEEKYFNIIQERIKNHTVKPNTINIISKEPSLFDIL